MTQKVVGVIVELWLDEGKRKRNSRRFQKEETKVPRGAQIDAVRLTPSGQCVFQSSGKTASNEWKKDLSEGLTNR